MPHRVCLWGGRVLGDGSANVTAHCKWGEQRQMDELRGEQRGRAVLGDREVQVGRGGRVRSGVPVIIDV